MTDKMEQNEKKRKRKMEREEGETNSEHREKDAEETKRRRIETKTATYTKTYTYTKTKSYPYVDGDLEMGRPYTLPEHDEETYFNVCVLLPYEPGWQREHKRDYEMWKKMILDSADGLGIRDRICTHKLDKLMRRWEEDGHWELHPWTEKVYLGENKDRNKLILLCRLFIPKRNDMPCKEIP